MNPFTPNFGQVPLHMAGRTELLQAFRAAFDEGVGNPDLCTIFKGARGTGKTALLMLLAEEAEQRGWIAASATAIPGMLEDLYEQVARKAQALVQAQQPARLKGVTIGQLLGLEWEPAAAPQLNWRSRMTRLLEALDQLDVGVLLTLDEVDPDLDEVVQLVTVYQHFVSENRKVSLLMAALPHRASSLLRGKSISFLRRANQETLGRIPSAEVADAFRQTVQLGGKRIADEALEQATEAIEGFPFMMQLVGYRSWAAAGDAPALAAEHVARGVALAESDMKRRVLRATLDELSPRDLDVLQALLPDAGATSAKDLAQRTGMTSGNVSTYKKRLLEQGVVEEAGQGAVRFALPLLRAYLPEYMEGTAL